MLFGRHTLAVQNLNQLLEVLTYKLTMKEYLEVTSSPV